MKDPKPKGTFVEMIQLAQDQARNEVLNELLVYLLQNPYKDGTTLKMRIVTEFIRPQQRRIKQSKTVKP